jgi:hypothetical protein
MNCEQLVKPSLGPSYQQRNKAAHAFLHEQELKYQNGDRLYPFIAGDHFLNNFGELGVVQNTIIQQIRTLAENPDITRPITYLDVGGGFGEGSLAMAIALEDLIVNGRAIFLVSNFEFIPKPENISKLLRLKKSDLNFFHKNIHRVRYIKSDVGHLAGLTIDTQHGPLKLFRNLDFIYEYNALSHSRTPDMDYWILGRALSQWGSLMLESQEIYPHMEEPDELKRNIETSMQVGINNLRQLGLRESAYKCYLLFQQCNAPSLENME